MEKWLDKMEEVMIGLTYRSLKELPLVSDIRLVINLARVAVKTAEAPESCLKGGLCRKCMGEDDRDGHKDGCIVPLVETLLADRE